LGGSRLLPVAKFVGELLKALDTVVWHDQRHLAQALS
jgi:hypothetical protein